MKLNRKIYNRCAPRSAHLCAPFPLGDVLGGAAGGIASGIVNSTLGQLLGRSNMRKQNEMQRENMAIANSYNRQNAMEQGVMRRMAMQGAGLNINSENGSFSPVAASSPLHVTPQNNPQTNIVDPSVAQSLMSLSQIPVNKSQVGVNQSQEAKNMADAAKAWADENFTNVQAENLPYVYSAQIEELIASANEKEKRLDEIDKEIELKDAEITKLGSDVNVNEANVGLLEQKENESIETQKQIRAEVSKIRATIENIKANTKLTDAQRKEAIERANKTIEERLFTNYQRRNIHKLWNSEIRKNHALQKLNEAQRRETLNNALLAAKEGDWYTYNEILKGVGVGTDVANSISKYVVKKPK